MKEIHRYFILGLDLGQSQDPTALAIIERQNIYTVGVTYEPGGRPPVQSHSYLYVLRHLKKFPLRTPYTTIADEVCTIFNSPSLHSRRQN